MTPDRIFHLTEELFSLYPDDPFGLEDVPRHLHKFHEVLDVCKRDQKLISLRGIGLRLYTPIDDIELLTRVDATVRNGALWTKWSEFQEQHKPDFYATSWET